MNDIDQKDRDRETLLDALYDATDGSTTATAVLHEIAPKVGLASPDADRASDIT
jgi:hypothetical protein